MTLIGLGVVFVPTTVLALDVRTHKAYGEHKTKLVDGLQFVLLAIYAAIFFVAAR